MKMLEKAESGKSGAPKIKEDQRAQEIDTAFMKFTSACVDNPEFALAYYKRGRCYMMMYDYKRALYDFSAAFFNMDRLESKQPPNSVIKSEPGGSALFYMYAGQCNYYLGQYEEAIAHYDIATTRDRFPEDYLKKEICYNQGLANASLGQYQKAIKNYTDSVNTPD